MERQINRHTDRQTDRYMERQINRHTDRETDRWITENDIKQPLK